MHDATDPRIEQARRAVAVVFAVNGLLFASWLARTPAIRDALELSPTGLGLLIVCLSVGALTALPLSGTLVGRFGPARSVRWAAWLAATGLAVAAVGISAGSVVLAGAGLGLVGYGSGTWDVAMNVEGADVQRRLGRILLPRFHAAFSLGTVSGAGLGAACAALGVGVTTQLLVTAGFAAITIPAAVSLFVPVSGTLESDAPRPSIARGWREPRTLLLGVMVLAFGLGEGIANDWLTIAVVDGHDGSDALGAATFAVFVSAMTLGRLFGAPVLERYGRPAVMRGLALAVVLGALLVALGPTVPWAIAGAAVWGLGASLGFPVGLSAAADEEEMATVRVSVVSSIGYGAFLAGPAVIGLLTDAFGILDALLLVPVVMVLAFAVAGASRPAGAARPATAP